MPNDTLIAVTPRTARVTAVILMAARLALGHWDHHRFRLHELTCPINAFFIQ